MISGIVFNKPNNYFCERRSSPLAAVRNISNVPSSVKMSAPEYKKTLDSFITSIHSYVEKKYCETFKRKPTCFERDEIIKNFDSVFFSVNPLCFFSQRTKYYSCMTQLSLSAFSWLCAAPASPAGFGDIIRVISSQIEFTPLLRSAIYLRASVLMEKAQRYYSNAEHAKWESFFTGADLELLKRLDQEHSGSQLISTSWQALSECYLNALYVPLAELLRRFMSLEISDVNAKRLDELENETRKMAHKIKGKISTAGMICFLHHHLNNKSFKEQLRWLDGISADVLFLGGGTAIARKEFLMKKLAGPGWLKTIPLMLNLSRKQPLDKRIEHSDMLPLMVPALTYDECKTFCKILIANQPVGFSADVIFFARFLTKKFATGVHPKDLLKKLPGMLRSQVKDIKPIYRPISRSQYDIAKSVDLATALLNAYVSLSGIAYKLMSESLPSTDLTVLQTLKKRENLSLQEQYAIVSRAEEARGQRGLDISWRQFQADINLSKAGDRLSIVEDQLAKCVTSRQRVIARQSVKIAKAQLELAGIQHSAAVTARPDVPQSLTDRVYKPALVMAQKKLTRARDFKLAAQIISSQTENNVIINVDKNHADRAKLLSPPVCGPDNNFVCLPLHSDKQTSTSTHYVSHHSKENSGIDKSELKASQKSHTFHTSDSRKSAGGLATKALIAGGAFISVTGTAGAILNNVENPAELGELLPQNIFNVVGSLRIKKATPLRAMAGVGVTATAVTGGIIWGAMRWAYSPEKSKPSSDRRKNSTSSRSAHFTSIKFERTTTIASKEPYLEINLDSTHIVHRAQQELLQAFHESSFHTDKLILRHHSNHKASSKIYSNHKALTQTTSQSRHLHGWHQVAIIAESDKAFQENQFIRLTAKNVQDIHLYTLYLNVPPEKYNSRKWPNYLSHILTDISVYMDEHDVMENSAQKGPLLLREKRYTLPTNLTGEQVSQFVITSPNESKIHRINWDIISREDIPLILIPTECAKKCLISRKEIMSRSQNHAGKISQISNLHIEHKYRYYNLGDQAIYNIQSDKKNSSLSVFHIMGAADDVDRATHSHEPYFSPWAWHEISHTSAENIKAWVSLLLDINKAENKITNHDKATAFSLALASVTEQYLTSPKTGKDITDIQSFVEYLIFIKTGKNISLNKKIIIRTYRKSLRSLPQYLNWEMTLWYCIKNQVNRNSYYNDDIIVKRYLNDDAFDNVEDFMKSLSSDMIRSEYDAYFSAHYKNINTEVAEKNWEDTLLSTFLINFISGGLPFPEGISDIEKSEYIASAKKIYFGEEGISLLKNDKTFASKAILLKSTRQDTYLFCPTNGLPLRKITIDHNNEVEDAAIEFLAPHFPPESVQKKRIARYNFFTQSGYVGDNFFHEMPEDPLQKLYESCKEQKKSLAHYIFHSKEQQQLRKNADILSTLMPVIVSSSIILTGGISSIPDLLALEGTELVMTEQGLKALVTGINFNTAILTAYPDYIRYKSDADKPLEAQKYFDNFVWGVATNIAMQNPLSYSGLTREEKLEELISLRHKATPVPESLEVLTDEEHEMAKLATQAGSSMEHVSRDVIRTPAAPTFSRFSPTLLPANYDYIPATGAITKYQESGVFEDITGQKFIFLGNRIHAVRNEGSNWWVHPVPNDDTNILVRRITGKNVWERHSQGLRGGGSLPTKESHFLPVNLPIAPLAEPELPFYDPLQVPVGLLELTREALGKVTDSSNPVISKERLENFFSHFWGGQELSRMKAALKSNDWFDDEALFENVWQEVLEFELLKTSYTFQNIEKLITRELPPVPRTAETWSIQLDKAITWITGASNSLSKASAEDKKREILKFRKILHQYLFQNQKDTVLNNRDALTTLSALVAPNTGHAQRIANGASYGAAVTGQRILDIFMEWLRGPGRDSDPIQNTQRLFGALIGSHPLEDGNGRFARTVYAINMLRLNNFVAPTASQETELHGLVSNWRQILQNWLWEK